MTATGTSRSPAGSFSAFTGFGLSAILGIAYEGDCRYEFQCLHRLWSLCYQCSWHSEGSAYRRFQCLHRLWSLCYQLITIDRASGVVEVSFSAFTGFGLSAIRGRQLPSLTLNI